MPGRVAKVLSEPLLDVRSFGLQIPQHAGPGFHVMPGRYSTASRATVP